MKRCDMCRVDVRGNHESCPLCGAKLYGNDEDALYPEITSLYRQFRLFFKILILSTVGSAVICVCINLLLPETGVWSLFAVFGVACFWVSFLLVLRKRSNVPKNICIQVVVFSLLCLVWDYITGWHGWSIEFFFPLACIGAMIAMAIVAKVMHVPVEDYIVCLFADIAFGILPLIFFLTNAISQKIPSVICIGFSFMSLLALVVFQGEKMKIELMKRFHL